MTVEQNDADFFAKAPWPKYRERLLPIMEEVALRNRHDFAKDVDDALLNGSAFLFVAEDGFLVLRASPREAVLWVTVMFAFNCGGNAIERYQAKVEEMTRQIGGRGIELFTAVEALSSSLLERGYVQREKAGNVRHWEKQL
ncbi:hypothetical protein [Enterovibrio norvegicus]|uniref:hypothetical protein n=1 Tax=Enterovibrio norvegicus TaxID=188144 RepID=UPI0002D5E50A|nr:hypothetical protein [Enterovibrio norvegicus]OEF57973.1 hypothetical protein A1OU_07130 [Enterovibrio norvegicus]